MEALKDETLAMSNSPDFSRGTQEIGAQHDEILGMESIDATSPQLQMRWKKISMAAFQGRKKNALIKPILTNVSGSATAGQLSCIIGRSGSGKSSLLAILAGQLQSSSPILIKGGVYINNSPITPWNKEISHDDHQQHRIAYVAQKDTLLPYSTPKEALTFSARMRLPRVLSDSDIEEIVCQTLNDLDLSHVADQFIKALSGGEARRVSLGLELVTNPKIVLLDEVTSGLDSHNAEIVVSVCRKIAQEHNVVMLMTIHQPNDAIFSLMDHVCVLHSGRALYEGDPSKLRRFFSERGTPVPGGTTVLDWAVKTADHYIVDLEEYSNSCHLRPNTHSRVPKPIRSQEPYASKVEQASARRIAVFTETKELVKRKIQMDVRDIHATAMKLMSILLMSLLVAFAVQGVGEDSLRSLSAFSSHVGVVFFMAACGSSVTLMLKIMECIVQMPTFQREFGTGHYRMLSFSLSTMLYDIVMNFIYTNVVMIITFWAIGLQGGFWEWYACIFLSCCISTLIAYPLSSIPNDPKVGMDFVPLVFTPQILFSGFLVAPDSLPVYAKWLVWFQPATYAFRLMSHNEFKDCVLDRSLAERHRINCAKALHNIHDDTPDLFSLYTEDSVMMFAQTGEYVGRENIEEYAEFISNNENSHSLLWRRNCAFKEENSQVVRVNDAGDGFCDVTSAQVSHIRINPKYALDNALFSRTVTGERFRFAFSKDLRSTIVEMNHIFLPPAWGPMVYDNVNSTTLLHETCMIMEASCPTVYRANGFSLQDDCIKRLGSLPITTVNSRGLVTVDGNSSGCRHLHATMAVQSPETHCAHLSFIPMEDRDGKLKCSQSYDRSSDDFFSPQDKNMFEKVALDAGMNTSYLFETTPEEILAECTNDDLIEPQVLQNANILPFDYFCEAFLESQDALGDTNTFYWMALISFVIVLQILSIVTMRRRATRDS